MAVDTASQALHAGTNAGSARHLRFHVRHAHLDRVSGSDTFGVKAEAFARFFGTPTFLIAQTVVVAVWVVVNALHLVTSDLYPFIPLNLAFSLQSAHAAPLILLAETREADRDKAYAEADAHHREELVADSVARQAVAAEQTARIMELLE